MAGRGAAASILHRYYVSLRLTSSLCVWVYIMLAWSLACVWDWGRAADLVSE